MLSLDRTAFLDNRGNMKITLCRPFSDDLVFVVGYTPFILSVVF